MSGNPGIVHASSQVFFSVQETQISMPGFAVAGGGWKAIVNTISSFIMMDNQMLAKLLIIISYPTVFPPIHYPNRASAAQNHQGVPGQLQPSSFLNSLSDVGNSI